MEGAYWVWGGAPSSPVNGAGVAVVEAGAEFCAQWGSELSSRGL